MSRTSLAAAIQEAAGRDPVLAHLVALVGPISYRPSDADGRFGALVRSIVFQQLAGNAARAIHARVRATVPGDLTPAAFMAVPDVTLRAAGLSANKLAALRDLSAKVIDGTVDLEKSARHDEKIIASLVTVRGIGRWTA
jgi:DNA-3-methyladenine glycosylase II